MDPRASNKLGKAKAFLIQSHFRLSILFLNHYSHICQDFTLVYLIAW